MALNVYSPPETAVIHKTTVDIGNIRPMAQVVKLTQGDKSLPLIAVKLLNSGQPYEIPESATDAVFNFRKGDKKAVINSALGISSDRQTVYVEATEQTCASAGRGEAIVQIQVGEQVAGTGIFCVDVTPNPTTDASLSETELGVLQELVDEANDAKADAQQSASQASQSATQAGNSATASQNSANLAEQAKDDVQKIVNDFEGTLPLIEDAHGESVTVNNSSQDVIYGLKLYGKSVQDGTPSPENPVPIESVESPTVKVYGENLVNVGEHTYENRGVTFTAKDGAVQVSGTATAESAYGINIPFLPKGTYFVNGGKGNILVRLAYRKTGEPYKYAMSGTSVTIDDEDTFLFQVYVNGGKTANDTVYPMLIRGKSALPFVQHTEQTLATHLNLNAVPVTSGGNYTDENGQMWLSDVADFGTGKITRNVIAKTFNGKESWIKSASGNAFCSGNSEFKEIDNVTLSTIIGAISNIGESGTWAKINSTTTTTMVGLMYGRGIGVRMPSVESIDEFKQFLSTTNLYVVGMRDEPTTEDIPAEVMQAYKNLHTNEGTTNVFTDRADPQAGIELRYRNDTKLADDVVEILGRRTEDMQGTIDSLSETVTDQAGEITELQSEIVSSAYKPNLLINSDFRINQRNIADDQWVSASENKRVYGLDGWHCYIEDNGGSVSATSRIRRHNENIQVNLQSNIATFGQYFETGRTIDEITVVFGLNDNGEIVRVASTFTGLAILSNRSYKQTIIQLNSTSMYLRLYRIVNDATNGFVLELRLPGNQNVTYEFAYIDAFEGTVAPPHTSEPLEIALARCQRYFYRLGGDDEATIGIGFLKNNSSVRTTIQFPVTMANPPTDIKAEGGVFQTETETNAYNSCVYQSAVSVTRDLASLNFTLSMPEQISGPIGVTVYENTGAHIDFSCEYYN